MSVPAPRLRSPGRAPVLGLRQWMAAGLIAVGMGGGPATAHPHVFVDGGVDFVLGTDRTLEALAITWIYDPFETLYMLAAEGISLNADGRLSAADRVRLIARLNDWPDDFDGSAHLQHGAEPVALRWPEGLTAQVVDGRLHVRFTRQLADPIALGQAPIELGFFERTYFFDFTITKTPEFLGAGADAVTGCTTQLVPFVPDPQDQELIEMLAKLGREESSSIANVGAVLADRIMLTCE